VLQQHREGVGALTAQGGRKGGLISTQLSWGLQCNKSSLDLQAQLMYVLQWWHHAMPERDREDTASHTSKHQIAQALIHKTSPLPMCGISRRNSCT